MKQETNPEYLLYICCTIYLRSTQTGRYCGLERVPPFVDPRSGLAVGVVSDTDCLTEIVVLILTQEI